MNKMNAIRYFSNSVLICVTLLITIMPCQGQLSRPGIPYPMVYPGSPQLKIYELTVTESQKSRALAVDDDSRLKPAKSGIRIDVDYSPDNSGTWDTVANGLKIWRAAFHVKDAKLLNLVFAPYQLNKGVRIFLYNTSRKTILGAFTDLNNKTVNVLATAYVPGDILVVEMQVPGYLRSPGLLTIDGVGCDFFNSDKSRLLKDGWFGTSGACNVDINCQKDSVYQIIKKAVVRIVYDGGERCTGTLVNNTLKDGVNYVVTAEHCISTEASANEAVFYFDYESPWCEGPDGSNFKSVSGATLRATGHSLDFTLLELLEPVPFTYQPYYAGWDVTGYPPSSGFTIHHPLGDVKKISEENHALTVATYGNGYDEQTHWLVKHWESGTTERGSSGAAFFDRAGRIAGTLTGGLANCVSSVNDYFQMFSHSWDDYPGQDNQLAFWLDPVNRHPGYLDGYDPYADFWSTGDTLSNILPGEQLVTERGNLTWGSYSGHNSDYLSGFAEKYSTITSKKMMGILLQVADNYVASSSASIVIKVWEGGNLPGATLYEKEIPLANLAEQNMNYVEFDSVIQAGKAFYAGYELQYNTPQDTFSTYMAQNRIMDQVNTAYVYDGFQWRSLDDHTGGTVYSSFGVMPVVFDSIPENPTPVDFTGHVIAYPNPASTIIWLEFRELSPSPAQVTMFNAQGQMVLEKKFGPYRRLISLEQLRFAAGVYIIRVRQGNMINNLKVTIIK